RPTPPTLVPPPPMPPDFRPPAGKRLVTEGPQRCHERPRPRAHGAPHPGLVPVEVQGPHGAASLRRPPHPRAEKRPRIVAHGEREDAHGLPLDHQRAVCQTAPRRTGGPDLLPL